MVFAARLAGIAAEGKFCEEDAAILFAMHFAQNSRASFLQQVLCAAKDFDFGAFDVTFQKIRRY